MFSVIIPAYNAELFIRNSIKSVLAQTIDNFEIVVVDDGSTDKTCEVIASIGDPRIQYIYQENGGVSSARNTGILNAKGEYVCFLDADDLWKPNHLEAITRLIEKFPECSVYLTGYELLLHNGKSVLKGYPSATEDIQSDNMFRQIWEHGYYLNTNCTACKRSVFEKVGLFAVGVKNKEDDDMWYRLFCYYSVAVTKEPTTIYIRENSRATASKVLIEDWIFKTRVKDMLVSDEVSQAKKDSLIRLMEQKELSIARAKILNKDKKGAWRIVKGLNIRLLRPRKYIETIIALLLPCSVAKKAVDRRDMTYYGE